MLFKRNKNKNTSDEEIVHLTEDELSQKRIKMYKKMERKRKIKKSIVYFFILLALFGGYKSLFSVPPVMQMNEVTDTAFTEKYVKAYMSYPKTEEESKLLSSFTMKIDESIDSSKIETQKVSKIDVYKIKNIKYGTASAERFYGVVTVVTKEKEAKEITKDISFRIDVARQGNRFIVVRPIQFTTYEIKPIVDETFTSQFVIDKKHTNQSLDETAAGNVKKTVELFLKTYNTNYAQAKLLVEGSVLDRQDSKNKLTLENIQQMSENEEFVFISCRIKETYDSTVSSTRNYYIELRKANNKITKMEVY